MRMAQMAALSDGNFFFLFWIYSSNTTGRVIVDVELFSIVISIAIG